MPKIKLIIPCLLMFMFGLASFTYASTLPANAEIPPIAIEQAESALSAGPVKITTTSGPVNTGTAVRIFAMANNPDGSLQNLTISVDGQVVKSSTRNRVMGSFTPTTPGNYVVSAEATYAGSIVYATPVTVVVQ